MKKNTLSLLVVAGVTSALLLTGCTSDSNNNQDNNGDTSAGGSNFDRNPEITAPPVWDISNLAPGMFGGDPNATATTVTNPDGSQRIQVPVDTYLDNYIFFENPNTKCNITGRITYSESYKQERGDLYNSKEALYSQVAPTEKPVSNESTVMIDDWEYVTGDWSSPSDENGSNTGHRSAVRVFDVPIAVEAGLLPTEFNYQSDPLVGLPTVMIDYSCPTSDMLNQDDFTKALNDIFTVDFTGGIAAQDSQIPTTTPGPDSTNPADPDTVGKDPGTYTSPATPAP